MEGQKPEPEFVTAEQGAALCGVRTRNVHEWSLRGELTAHRPYGSKAALFRLARVRELAGALIVRKAAKAARKESA